MAKPKKRTIQVEVWSDDDEAVAALVNTIRLAATAVAGPERQIVTFSGIGVKPVRAALSDVEWRSANVRGRMKMTS